MIAMAASECYCQDMALNEVLGWKEGSLRIGGITVAFGFNEEISRRFKFLYVAY